MTESTVPMRAKVPGHIGFAGWGQANQMIFQLLQARSPRLGAELRLLAPAAGTDIPADVRTVPTVEGLLGESGPIFVDLDSAALQQVLPLMRLAISDRNIMVLAGDGLSAGTVLRHLHERKLIRCLVTPFQSPAQATLAYYATPYVQRSEMAVFRALFEHVECVVQLDSEVQFEVARGLAGVAPAVFFTMVDAMADGALMTGLPRAEALPFLASVMLGAAHVLRESGEHPALLRERTLAAAAAAAGLMEFESAGLRGLMMRVVDKAIRQTRIEEAAEPPSARD